MSTDEIYQTIAQKRPPVIYVSGKTSTGKSTFGRKLHDELDYHVIELEAVVSDIVRRHNLDERVTFGKILYDSEESEEKNLFFAITDKMISEAVHRNNRTVIEGAVANTKTLQRILQPAPNLYFVYFHPANIDIYVRNLTDRFMQSGERSYGGLPPTFWRCIDDQEFSLFCRTRELSESLKNSIRQYALTSQKESLARLNEFRQVFDAIVVVEIQ